MDRSIPDHGWIPAQVHSFGGTRPQRTTGVHGERIPQPGSGIGPPTSFLS
jgi:hypothetical protein